MEKKDETTEKKLKDVLCMATEAVPSSVSLWHTRLRYLLVSGQEKEAEAVFSKVRNEILKITLYYVAF